MRKASQQAVCPVPCYGYSFGGGNNCQPVIEMHIHFRSNTPTVLACQWPGFDSLADGLTFFFFFFGWDLTFYLVSCESSGCALAFSMFVIVRCKVNYLQLMNCSDIQARSAGRRAW